MLRTQGLSPVALGSDPPSPMETPVDEPEVAEWGKVRVPTKPPTIPGSLPARCPMCGFPTAPHASMPRIEPRCLRCGYPLWCRVRIVDEVVILDALPGRDLNSDDVAVFSRSFVWPSVPPRVVVNLYGLDYTTSGFLAAMITFQRCIRDAGGTLVLCGARPLVRGIFARTHLDTLFEFARDEENAVNRLHAELADGWLEAF